MSLAIEDLIESVQRKGWDTFNGTIAQLRMQAQAIKAVEVPIRRGDPALSLLKPTDKADAHPSSLSSKYGAGAQPLHTDGAHLLLAPDLLVLSCESTSAVPTKVWKRGNPFSPPWPQYLRHGMFLVMNGKDSFFAPAYADLRLRYDPGCMVPCDARSRQVVAYFDDCMADAEDQVWDSPGKVLVIDNRKVLHARSSAVDEPERQIQRLALRLVKAAS